MEHYQAYRPYVSYLERLILSTSQGQICDSDAQQAIAAALDGQAASELRSRVPVEEMRRDGAFFTGSELTGIALSDALKEGGHDSVYLDPACGTGDLLIACTRRFYVETSLSSTLKQWGKRLVGRDIYPEFVEATRARLALMAIQRGARASLGGDIPLAELLPNIQVGDGLGERVNYKKTSNIVMNPPFTMVQAPDSCTWSRGKVNYAAIFVENCVQKVTIGTRLTAILPDVLRSGSRYTKWREHISPRLKIHSITPRGRFDKHADVDVFIFDATVFDKDGGEPLDQWWAHSCNQGQLTIGQNFRVHVGPVVPHRHVEEGELYPYIHAKNLPTWGCIDSPTENRRFSGTVFKPPFVAVRRTSSPQDRYRAIGTIVVGHKPIAVENHLLVLKPLNGSVELCQQLIRLLQMPSTNHWLNERIRCRHLTVSAVKEIPWNIESP